MSSLLHESREAFLADNPRRRGAEHDVATWWWGEGRAVDLRFVPSTGELYAYHRVNGRVGVIGEVASADLAQAMILLPGSKVKDINWVRRRILAAPTDPDEIAEAIARQRHAWQALEAVEHG